MEKENADNRILVVAPHPDDETLGAGGLLLRRKLEGAILAWVIVTTVSDDFGWSEDQCRAREAEIGQVADAFGFDEVFQLKFPATLMDQVPDRELVARLAEIMKSYAPSEVLLPHASDAHSDHTKIYKAGVSCSKWFRCSPVRRLISYETLSETRFGGKQNAPFFPNIYVNIERELEEKIRIMEMYRSEMGAFPFPRSAEAIRALAMTRGAESGVRAAEAFELLLERTV